MRRTDSLQGSIDLLVLKILSRRPHLHGYAIMNAIEEISGEVLQVERRLPLSGFAPDRRSRLDKGAVGHKGYGTEGPD